MKGHWIWMVLGCGLPLLLIFFAPALGITGYNGIFAFIILMFVFHLIMPHGSHGHDGHKHDKHNQTSHDHRSEESREITKEEQQGHQHH